MANPFTGENEAVVQVSEGTINRLMATLHQNAGTTKELPSHPHSMSVHITESESVNGVFGWFIGQLGVPQVHLLHRATDRFELELNVRARFFPDEGSAPLPEFIHGVVRATYKIHPIDEDCRGWRTRAEKYLWVRVVKNTVTFTGTAIDDVMLVNDPAVDKRIERLIADLLDNRFEAEPQEVGKKFRPGRLISLRSAEGDALALPINLPGGGVVNDIESIRRVFLNGHDFAVAIGADWLMTQITPMRDKVAQLSDDFSVTTTYGIDVDVWVIDVEVDLVEVTTHYRVHVRDADFTWEDGFIKIKISGDVENTDLGIEVAEFTIKDRIDIEFDAAKERINLVHHTYPNVTVHIPAVISLFAPSGSADEIAQRVDNALKKLPSIPLAAYKQDLLNQLHKLDDGGDVRFEDAEFSTDGIVVRGRIDVSKRRRPVVAFKKSDGEPSFTAFSSWAPGGWIERFVWTWYPDYLLKDSRTIRDRYVISSRPTIQSRWGKNGYVAQDPLLPGLHGSGEVCLEIRGKQVDPVTGRMKKFTKRMCRRYGQPLPFLPGGADDRLLVKLKSHSPGELEIGVMELGGAPVDQHAANTLVVYSGGGFDRETARILTGGLEASTREDAGLRILYLLSEDAALSGGAEFGSTIASLSDHIGAYIDIVEDIGGAWTRQFGMNPEGTAWLLITPNGGLTWEHEGLITQDELGETLDDHLRASPPPNFQTIGAAVSATHVAPRLSLGKRPATRRRNCPRVLTTPLTSLVTFVRGGLAASERQLAQLSRVSPMDSDASIGVIAVVDGGDDVADALSEKFDGIEIIADTAGVLAERFGVRIWPTTVGIQDGTVTGVREGLFDITIRSAADRDDTDDDDDDDSSGSEAS